MESKTKALPRITQEQVMAFLDKGYDLALNGLPKFDNCFQFADEYMKKYPKPKEAAENLARWQIMKCTTSGFVTSLGGVITMPITIPANIASVLYIQLRMIAAVAIIGGYNPKDDQVRTFVYMCLVGMSLTDVFKKSAVGIANKIGTGLVKKIPGEVLKKINRRVGCRLLTKFGTKGSVNIAKLVPVLGGVVGGSVDFLSTKTIASRAIKMFVEEKIVITDFELNTD